ncbi:hypothetical protein JG687_00018314 [Phytophthora cactorum]|uniref:Uncharacterized protein n=1 Tax=Phytophthora cactorum TaxID=29920 RepID=A0A8T1TQY3_9STRA|nr:hypothetical protein JG687_00018314 [Phytophthora cactorum]
MRRQGGALERRRDIACACQWLACCRYQMTVINEMEMSTTLDYLLAERENQPLEEAWAPIRTVRDARPRIIAKYLSN